MAGLVAQVGRTLRSSLATPVTPITTTPTPTTATPTPTTPPPTTSTPQCPPGYPYYNAADNKCYQQAPTAPTPTPAPVTLPPGFPTNLPSGTYQLSLCGTGVGCINLGTQEFNSNDIAELVNRLQQAISQACQGDSGCTTTYSAFNGSSFTATMKWVDGCVPGDPNSCIRGQDEIVVTKVG